VVRRLTFTFFLFTFALIEWARDGGWKETDVMSLTFGLAGLIVGASFILLATVVLLSRHKKAASGQLDLIESMAVVETTLKPEGSVLVRGELWRARSLGGTTVERGGRVRVVGASGHLLEVEPTR
jgi:membrane-bound ClpP family serine protease